MRKKKIKAFFIYDEVYKSYIYIIVCKNKLDVLPYAKKYWNMELTQGRMGEGCTWTVDGVGCVVWLEHFNRTPKYLSILYHELFHVVAFILGDRAKIPLSDESEEAYCYYMEAISKKILEHLTN